MNLTMISNAFLNGFWKSLKSLFWCISFLSKSQILRWSKKKMHSLEKWVELIKQRFLPHLLVFIFFILFLFLCIVQHTMAVYLFIISPSVFCFVLTSDLFHRPYWVDISMYVCTDVFLGVHKYWLHKRVINSGIRQLRLCCFWRRTYS